MVQVFKVPFLFVALVATLLFGSEVVAQAPNTIQTLGGNDIVSSGSQVPVVEVAPKRRLGQQLEQAGMKISNKEAAEAACAHLEEDEQREKCVVGVIAMGDPDRPMVYIRLPYTRDFVFRVVGVILLILVGCQYKVFRDSTKRLAAGPAI